jgi:hypothetical protein
MTTIINADTITGGAIITGDTSGNLALQSGGVTGLTVSAGGTVNISGPTNITPSTFTAQSSATDITLTTSSNGFQLLSFTASNLAVILPAATAYTFLGQKFNIRNAGSNAFKIENSSGKTIYWVKPNAVAQVWLKSNTGTSYNWEIFTGDNESDNGLAWLGTKILAVQNNAVKEGVNSSLTAMMAPDLFYLQYYTGTVYRSYITQEIAENQWAATSYASPAGLIPSGGTYGKGTVVDETSFYWAGTSDTTLYLVTATRAVGTSSPSMSLTNTLTTTGLTSCFTMYSHSTSLQLATGTIPTSFNPGICVISGVGAAATVTSAQSIALGTNAAATKRTDAIMFDATNGLLCAYDATLQTHYFKLFNLSGTTITYTGTTQTIAAAFSTYADPSLRLARVSATEALYYYELSSSPFTKRAVKIVFNSGTNDITVTSYDLTSTYNTNNGFSAAPNVEIYYIFSQGMVLLYQEEAKIFLQKLTLNNGTPQLSGAMRTDYITLVENSDTWNQAVDSKCDALALRYTEEPEANKYVYFFRTLLVNNKD